MKTRGFCKHLLLLAVMLLAITGSANGQADEGEPTEEESACIMESATLNTNANISAATQDLLTTAKEDMLSDFSQFCRLISLTCTADISSYSGDLRAACEAEGGQLAQRNYDLACETDTASPVEIPGTVELLNLPACVGASCDLTNLPPSLTQILDDVVVTLNTEVDAALGERVTCEVGTGMGSATGTGSSAPKSMNKNVAWSLYVGTLSLVLFWAW